MPAIQPLTKRLLTITADNCELSVIHIYKEKAGHIPLWLGPLGPSPATPVWGGSCLLQDHGAPPLLSWHS